MNSPSNEPFDLERSQVEIEQGLGAAKRIVDSYSRLIAQHCVPAATGAEPGFDCGADSDQAEHD